MSSKYQVEDVIKRQAKGKDCFYWCHHNRDREMVQCTRRGREWKVSWCRRWLLGNLPFINEICACILLFGYKLKWISVNVIVCVCVRQCECETILTPSKSLVFRFIHKTNVKYCKTTSYTHSKSFHFKRKFDDGIF